MSENPLGSVGSAPILAVFFSQTGQLRRVADAVLAPLQEAGRSVVRLELEPQTPYPFPWPFLEFFNCFPETVQLKPAPLRTFHLPQERPRLVILFWQPWFLSPSGPITAFLQSPQARQMLQGMPVISIIACRNMWYSAFDRLRDLIQAAGGILRDNAVIEDRGGAATFVTTPWWLLTGRRQMWPGAPLAGVTDADIAACRRFGEAMNQRLAAPDHGKPMLSGCDAVRVNVHHALAERMALRSFRLWAALLMAVGPPQSLVRRGLLLVYALFLVCMILTLLPIAALLRRLWAILSPARVAAIRARYAAPSGSHSSSAAS